MADDAKKRLVEAWAALEQLGIEHSCIPEGLGEDEFSAFEQQIGRGLPETFRISLALHGADDYGFEMPGPKSLAWSVEKWTELQGCDFEGIFDIRSWVPVGGFVDSDGYLLCIDATKEEFGEVRYYDHETETLEAGYGDYVAWILYETDELRELWA